MSTNDLSNTHNALKKLNVNPETQEGIVQLIDIQTNSNIDKVLNKIDSLRNEMNVKFDAVDSKFNAIESKFDSKFIILMWAIGGIGFPLVIAVVMALIKYLSY